MKMNTETSSALLATNASVFATALTAAAIALLVAGANGFAQTKTNDWKVLWQPTGAVMPEPSKVRIGSLKDLGPEVENREWLMVSTKYHQVLFQNSADRNKVAELCQLIDRLYIFVEGRSPAKPAGPIQAFLIPNERGRSRCSQNTPAMRTGELGDLSFLLTSLLHEETHLFNFAFLGGRPQGWWTGEFCCLYFQERGLLEHESQPVKQEIQSRLPRGPIARLTELDAHGKNAFDEALAVQFFLEEEYGRELLKEFRRQSLVASKASGGGRLPEKIFQQVFGKGASSLDAEWRTFYGWTDVGPEKKPSVADARLDAKVSYAVQKESLQYVVLKLAAQSGLNYDFEKSKNQTDPLCRSWLNNVSIENKTGREALDTILDPLGLRYEIEGETIVLYRK